VTALGAYGVGVVRDRCSATTGFKMTWHCPLRHIHTCMFSTEDASSRLHTMPLISGLDRLPHPLSQFPNAHSLFTPCMSSLTPCGTHPPHIPHSTPPSGPLQRRVPVKPNTVVFPALADIAEALRRQPGHPMAAHLTIHLTEAATPGVHTPAEPGYAGEGGGRGK